MKDKAVIIYSGGMDSFTLLNELHQTHDVHAVSFNYGQRHVKELSYARAYTHTLGIPHHVVDLTSINPLLQGSALTTPAIDVPEGHYEAENMKQTVVLNRNMIMLSIASAYALSIGAPIVAIGAHAGDHAIYPDCRPVFIKAVEQAINQGNYGNVSIHAPYINMSKGDIAKVGKELGINYGYAWTCYNGLDKACGKCGACQERIEAMAEAGVDDPMEYAA